MEVRQDVKVVTWHTAVDIHTVHTVTEVYIYVAYYEDFSLWFSHFSVDERISKDFLME